MRKQQPEVFHGRETVLAFLTLLYGGLQEKEQTKVLSKMANWTYWNLLTRLATTSQSSVTARPGPTLFMRMEWLNMILVSRSTSL